MNLQPITLNVPESLYNMLKQRAEQNRRTVEAETLDVLVVHVCVGDQLPAELEKALSELARLDDQALWAAAKNRMASDAAATMEELHLKRQRESLTPTETDQLADLVRQYERLMLVRAQAAALLQKRGHNVDSLRSRP